jgi:hypothetical protein
VVFYVTPAWVTLIIYFTLILTTTRLTIVPESGVLGLVGVAVVGEVSGCWWLGERVSRMGCVGRVLEIGVVAESRGSAAFDVSPTVRSPLEVVLFPRGPVERSARVDVGRAGSSPVVEEVSTATCGCLGVSSEPMEKSVVMVWGLSDLMSRPYNKQYMIDCLGLYESYSKIPTGHDHGAGVDMYKHRQTLTTN